MRAVVYQSCKIHNSTWKHFQRHSWCKRVGGCHIKDPYLFDLLKSGLIAIIYSLESSLSLFPPHGILAWTLYWVVVWFIGVVDMSFLIFELLYLPHAAHALFLVHLQATAYIRNIGNDMGYDSDDNITTERIWATSRQQLSTKPDGMWEMTLRVYGLPDQRICLLVNDNIWNLINGQPAPIQIEETDLRKDLFTTIVESIVVVV